MPTAIGSQLNQQCERSLVLLLFQLSWHALLLQNSTYCHRPQTRPALQHGCQETKGIKPGDKWSRLSFPRNVDRNKEGQATKLSSLSHPTFVCDLLMRGTGAGTGGDGRSLRKGISQKLFHEGQTCKKRTRKLVKSFAYCVKTCMVEKHASQQICQLHPVEPKKKFSARKKTTVTPHFSGFQSQCLQPKACTRLSDSTTRCLKNFPLGLQETRCLNKVATQDDPVKLLEV